MDYSEALGLAAQAWCKKDTENKIIDVTLAKEFAHILKREVDIRDELIRDLTQTKPVVESNAIRFECA